MAKYLATFDIETTGLNKQEDYIIQFAGIKVDKSTNEIVDTINYKIKPIGNYNISLAAYFKHGILPESLVHEKTFLDVADKITKFFEDADILTYNGLSFDIPFLINEYTKNGLTPPDFLSYNVYDAFLEEKRRNGNTLDDTYKRYVGKSMEDNGLTTHDALSDVKATFEIFNKQQEKSVYGPEKMYDEDNFIKDMEFCGEIKPCFSFGKYKSISVDWVAKNDKQYMNWAINMSNFKDSTKEYLKTYM